MDSPYQPGALLQLRIPQVDKLLSVLIRQVFEPSTMAVVLRVSLETKPPTGIGQKGDIVVLKLCDRRFAEDLRRNHRAAQYSSAVEAEYLQDLIKKPPGSSGLPDPAHHFLTGRLRGDEGTERDSGILPEVAVEADSPEESGDGPVNENGPDLEAGEIEDYEEEEEKEEEEDDNEEEEKDEEDDIVSEYDEELYGTPIENLRPLQWHYLYVASYEQKVYERLRPLQLEGRVPTFLSSVELVIESLSLPSSQLPEDMAEESTAQIRQCLSIPGILISLIEEDAFPALNLGDNAPREDWPKGLQAAADIINDWGELGVYNEDARPENIMLKKLTTDEGTVYKAIALDFAQARVRRKDETDQEWKEHKYKRDEEGAVLAVMRGSRSLNLGQKYSWRTEGLGGTARYCVLEDDMVYYWGGGCTGSAYA